MIRTKQDRVELLYLLVNALLLIFFAAFVYFKTRGLGDEGWLSYPYIAGFAGLGFGLVFIWNIGLRRWQNASSESHRDGILHENQRIRHVSCRARPQAENRKQLLCLCRRGRLQSSPGIHSLLRKPFHLGLDSIDDSPCTPSSPIGTAFQIEGRDGLSEMPSRWDSTDPSEGNFDSHASSRNPKLWLIVFILYLALLFAYDFSVAEAWIDAKGDVETAQELREQGLTQFLKSYHHQTAHEILHSEAGQKGLVQYAKLLSFYPLEQRLNALDQSHKRLENNRRQHHPPSFFVILATWMGVSDSLLSIKVFAKFMLLLYLLVLWLMLRNLLKDQWLALSGALAMGLMPALLLASQAPRNDLPFGIVSALIAMLLIHIARSEKVPWSKHLLLGVLCFLAINAKFTALLIALPVLAIYFYRYRLQAFKYLLLVAIPVILIPILLYLITGYDMLLNIITGRIVQDAWIAENTSTWSFITQRVLFGQFRIGLPLMLLVLFTLPQVVKRKEQRPQLILFIFYLSSFFLLWGSSIDRHQIGFLPFAVPLISLALAQYQKLLKPILILLLLYNLLFIFYAVVDNAHDREHVLPLAQEGFPADLRR